MFCDFDSYFYFCKLKSNFFPKFEEKKTKLLIDPFRLILLLRNYIDMKYLFGTDKQREE